MKSVAHIALLSAGLVMSAAAVAGHRTDGAHAQPHVAKGASPDAIAFEMRSWGALVTQWSVQKDGAGFWIGTATDALVVGERVTARHDLAMGAQAFGEIAAILSALPDPAPDAAQCATFMTDQPYGIVRIMRAATTTEIAWNAGCRDAAYVAFLDVLKAADTRVARAGRKSPVIPD